METFKKRTAIKMEKEKDKCVSCGVEADYDRDEHVDRRNYYIEGAGQLCQKCWTKIYDSD